MEQVAYIYELFRNICHKNMFSLNYLKNKNKINVKNHSYKEDKKDKNKNFVKQKSPEK